jgi:acetyl-CoA synthetase
MEPLKQENRVFNPPADFVKGAAIPGMEAYKKLCDEANSDYDGFWGRLAKENIYWKKPFTKVLDESKAPFYKWFEDGTTNASYNCLDRQVEAGLGDKTAIIFEADDGTVTKVTYKEMLERVCKMANALRKMGVNGNDHRRYCCDASMCSYRCNSLCSFWWLLCPSIARSHYGRWCSSSDYC